MEGDAHSPSRRFPLLAAVSGALAMIWLLALCAVWMDIAGQAGSPRPDDWDRLERILDVVQSGLLPALILAGLTPVAWFAERWSRWLACFHPTLLAILCADLYMAYLAVPAHQAPAFAAVSHRPPQLVGTRPAAGAATDPPTLCWPLGESPLPTDVGALTLKIGDLALIQSVPEVYTSIAADPAQAARIRAWVGRMVRITGVSPGGGVWFAPADAAGPPDTPRLCLRWSDLRRVPTHG